MSLLKPEAIAMSNYFLKDFSSVFGFRMMETLNYIPWCCLGFFSLGNVLVVTHLFAKFLYVA